MPGRTGTNGNSVSFWGRRERGLLCLRHSNSRHPKQPQQRDIGTIHQSQRRDRRLGERPRGHGLAVRTAALSAKVEEPIMIGPDLDAGSLMMLASLHPTLSHHPGRILQLARPARHLRHPQAAGMRSNQQLIGDIIASRQCSADQTMALNLSAPRSSSRLIYIEHPDVPHPSIQLAK